MNEASLEQKPEGGQVPRSKPELKVIKEGIHILSRIHSLFKVTKIFALNNQLVAKEIDKLETAIKDSTENYGQTSFLLHQNSVFFNGIKLKFGYSNYSLFRFIMNEMEAREINLIQFLPGLERDELSAFIILIHQEIVKTSRPIIEFKEKLMENDIRSIHVEKIIPSAIRTQKALEKDASQVYFWSINHLKEIFTQHKEDQRIPLLTAKRLIQSIFNKISERESFIQGLTTIKNFDEYTLNHSVNVCILALALGNRIGLDKKELVDLGISAFFHDIGKLEIPVEILNKPGKLDQTERQIIENHPHLGAHKLITLREHSYIPVKALNVAMEHHALDSERGYPRYSKKENIQLFSKIVKIVDVYDALTTERPYRERVFTQIEAIRLMVEEMAVEFDPVLLKVFVKMIGPYPVGSLVLLDSGEFGIVYESNLEQGTPFRPKVKLITDAQGQKIDGPIVDLNEKDPDTQDYRSILKILDPNKYNICVPDYFMAQVM